jgi:membrane protease YdiL (CAAX protease family)
MKHSFQNAEQDTRSRKKKIPKITPSVSANEKADGEKKESKFITPTLLVFSTYALLLFSKIVDLTLINRENEYYTVVILQLMIFLLPGAIWCKYKGDGYVKGLRMRLPRPSSFLIMLSATLLMISGGLLLSVLFGGLESLSQNFSLYDTFISKSNGTIPSNLYLLIAYAVIPAICEEFIFRGILCREYEKGGVVRAVVFSALFFAMLHFNPINILTYLFSGVILALVLYATRSLFAAIITHLLYNIFGLFGQRYMNTLYKITGSEIFFIFIVTFVFLLSAALFCRQGAKLYKKHLYDGVSSSYRRPIAKTPEAIRATFLKVIFEPATILCVIFYIVASIIYLIN